MFLRAVISDSYNTDHKENNPTESHFGVENDFNCGLSTYTRKGQEKQLENIGNKLKVITSKSQLMHEDSCILSEQPRFQ